MTPQFRSAVALCLEAQQLRVIRQFSTAMFSFRSTAKRWDSCVNVGHDANDLLRNLGCDINKKEECDVNYGKSA